MSEKNGQGSKPGNGKTIGPVFTRDSEVTTNIKPAPPPPPPPPKDDD